jgi:hypothetical protein
MLNQINKRHPEFISGSLGASQNLWPGDAETSSA